MLLFVTAISLGFFASFHCVGMCGPIVLSLPMSQGTNKNRVNALLMYNLGRIVTYSILGFIFGLLGKGFVLAGYQQKLSIVIGVLLLLSVLIPAQLSAKLKLTRYFSQLLIKLKMALGKLLHQPTSGSLYLIGALNGLLPCGLVYLGIAAAIAAGTPLKGAFFMASMGLGTVPALLTISLLGSKINAPVRNKINQLVPVFIGVMAILLILRGLNLGIPYVSPKMFSNNHQIVISCCHK